jgi:hypothetical protein
LREYLGPSPKLAHCANASDSAQSYSFLILIASPRRDARRASPSPGSTASGAPNVDCAPDTRLPHPRSPRISRAAADERATANSILSWSFSAYRRDQWRISSNYNVVKLLIGTGYKPSVEAVRAFVAQFAWCSVAHTAVIVDAPRAQKKSANLYQAAEKFRGDFSFERSLSRTSTLAGQGTLPSPTTGCRIRFPESRCHRRLPWSRYRYRDQERGDGHCCNFPRPASRRH